MQSEHRKRHNNRTVILRKDTARENEQKRGIDREKERESQLRLSGSGVDYLSYAQSRMNHSSQQSRAIRYVRQRENCPFVFKENLCTGDQNTKRHPLTWQIPAMNEFTNRFRTVQTDEPAVLEDNIILPKITSKIKLAVRTGLLSNAFKMKYFSN